MGEHLDGVENLASGPLPERQPELLAVQLGIADTARPAPSDLAVLLAELAEGVAHPYGHAADFGACATKAQVPGNRA
jgi:hypothetical protein